ncbi:hypothetical protein [Enterococcus phage phiSHEF13]|uniref:Uncharacterized protein n=1 Tax=Enterococcus phage phiSHEF13 TaxID=2918648 RepID=A0AAE9FKK1_9CAUD|nr:hypothetical protein [Enterococcus phage phiSHEF13]
MELKPSPFIRQLEELTTEELCAYAKYKKQREYHAKLAQEQQEIVQRLDEKMRKVLVGEKTC